MNDPAEIVSGSLRGSLGSATLYLGAQIGAKLIGLVYFLLLARWLDVGMFGILTYAATFALLADLVADLGMGRVLLREVARAPEAAGRLIAVMLPSKLIVGFVLYAMIVVGVAGRLDEPGALLVFGILTVNVAATGAAVLLEQALHARGRFDYAAASHFVPSVVQLASGALFYAAGGGAPAFAAALCLGGVTYLGIILAGLRRLRVRVSIALSWQDCKSVVISALPFAAVTVLLLLSFRVEFLVLGQIAEAEQIGWYGSAARLFEAALTASCAFGAVITPRLVQGFHSSAAAGETLYGHFARIMTMGTVAIALTGWIFAAPLVDLLLPDAYAPATPLLMIMLLGYPFLSLHLLNISAMLALPSQNRPAVLMAVLVTVQIAIAASMTATAGERGAALAVAISAGVSALASTVGVRLWLTRKLVPLRACVPAAVAYAAGALLLWSAGEAGILAQAAALFCAGLAALAAALVLPISAGPSGPRFWKAEPLRD